VSSSTKLRHPHALHISVHIFVLVGTRTVNVKLAKPIDRGLTIEKLLDLSKLLIVCFCNLRIFSIWLGLETVMLLPLNRSSNNDMAYFILFFLTS
jgi:hypothetical protein